MDKVLPKEKAEKVIKIGALKLSATRSRKTEHQIIGKLRRFLKGSVNDEVSAVYFMVEVRKLIEHHNGESVFPSFELLNFYCDWVVHTRLERATKKPEVQNLLRMIDKEILENGIDDPGFQLAEFIGLIKLSTELERFLKYFNLPTKLAVDTPLWRGFLLALVKVLEDQPLEIRIRDISIDELRITKVVDGIVYGRVKLRDGRESKTDVDIS